MNVDKKLGAFAGAAVLAWMVWAVGLVAQTSVNPRITGRTSQLTVLCFGNAALTAPADTNENILATCTVRGGTLGSNGSLHVYTTWSFTNNANSKTLRVRFSGIGGSQYLSTNPVSNLAGTFFTAISNRNATNSQIGGLTSGSFLASTGSLTTSSVDTTADQTLVITAQKATAGDSVLLERYLVELINP